METLWKYGGGERPFCICEAEDVGKLTEALRCFGKEGNSSKRECGEAAGSILDCCERIRSFFDVLFGEGEGVRICGEEYNAAEHARALADFSKYTSRQIRGLERIRRMMEERESIPAARGGAGEDHEKAE